MAPLAIKKWKKIGDASKTPLLDRLHEKFEFELNQPIKDAIDCSMNKKWKEYRCRLHKKFEGMGGNGDIRLAKTNKLASTRGVTNKLTK
ncbi:Hypothetical predicted protein [Olea europaea subsp. europaea]|uniref:Uncharacterized protein n=1 Tax=Olea europaea subsp. europaea TaxID=158383 RepID=A0A8S0R430_OLEEU|nr:Hypothetical predicted protein [Olea europaea subsp. europaea]